MKQEVEFREENPLKWPNGHDRTQIRDRKKQSAWKKSMKDVRAALHLELKRMGAVECLITFNPSPSDRQDPGAAVYFSMKREEDYSWQAALGLNNPMPTLKEIDDAFKAKAMVHHPDRGGDAALYQAFLQHRENAKAWILGKYNHEHDYVIAIDSFEEVRLNLQAIKLAIAAMRQLERVGAPTVLERAFRGFRTALTAGASTEVRDGAPVA